MKKVLMKLVPMNVKRFIFDTLFKYRCDSCHSKFSKQEIELIKKNKHIIDIECKKCGFWNGFVNM
jgi:DNA-directed RNA polymerase subunit RPC12/RpoP